MHVTVVSHSVKHVDSVQLLQTRLSVPGRDGISTAISVQSDHDSITFGLDFIFPTTRPETFKRFPHCAATAQTRKKGYASLWGWIQL
ncbi:hypothetical protein LA080_010592 [Diaporthe eres]|nr:hypothetical protein LA080_010592 [Diaporthe eres]